jgi:hypothetical protein
MKLALHLSALAAVNAVLGATLPGGKGGPQFDKGQPIDGNGKGAPLLGLFLVLLLLDISTMRS